MSYDRNSVGKINWGGVAFWAYAVIGVLTFGNAFVHFEQRSEINYQICIERAKELGTEKRSFCELTTDNTVLNSYASLVAWPLYWSYRIAAKNETGVEKQ